MRSAATAEGMPRAVRKGCVEIWDAGSTCESAGQLGSPDVKAGGAPCAEWSAEAPRRGSRPSAELGSRWRRHRVLGRQCSSSSFADNKQRRSRFSASASDGAGARGGHNATAPDSGLAQDPLSRPRSSLV